MSSEANKFKLGLFVLVAIVILLGGLFVLGGQRLFQSTIPGVTLFDESVQGLEIGARVKMRGVPIGRVRAIQLRPEDALIQVDMDLTIESSGLRDFAAFRKYMEQQIREGMASRLGFVSITGEKYIEIEYMRTPPPAIIVNANSLPKDAIYIPSGKSLLANVAETVSTTLAKLDTTLDALNKTLGGEPLENSMENIQAMTARLRKISEDLSEQISGGEIASTLAEFRATSESIRQVAASIGQSVDDADLTGTTAAFRQVLDETRQQITDAKLAETTTSFRDTMGAAKALVENLEQTSMHVRALAENADRTMSEMQLPATTESARGTMESARGAMESSAAAVQSIATLQRDFRLALRKLNTTLDQLSEFVRYLDDNPAALLRGKPETD